MPKGHGRRAQPGAGAGPAEPFASLRARAGDRSHPNLQLAARVLGALTDVIKAESGGTASPTAYFGALMTALEAPDAEHTQALLYLLSLLLPHVPVPLLRKHSAGVFTMLTAVLSSPGAEDAALLRPALGCLGTALAALEASPAAGVWRRPDVLRQLNALLSFTVDPRPRVRRVAQAAAATLVRAHAQAGATEVAGALTSFCLDVLSECNARNATTAMQLLTLLQGVMRLLPVRGCLAPLCDAVLRLPAVGNARLTTQALRCLQLLCSDGGATESDATPLPVPFLAQLVTAILDVMPQRPEHTAMGDFAGALGAAMRRLGHVEVAGAHTPSDASGKSPHLASGALAAPSTAQLLPRAVLSLVLCFESGDSDTHAVAAKALAGVLDACVDPTLVAQSRAAAASSSHGAGAGGSARRAPYALERVASALESLLEYRYQGAWLSSLSTLAVLFERVGEAAFPLLVPLLAKAANLFGALSRLRGDDAEEVGADSGRAAKGKSGARGARGRVRGGQARKRGARAMSSDDSSDSDAGDGDGDGAAGGGSVSPARVQRSLKVVIGAALRAMGPQRFLETLPLVDPADAEADETVGGVVPERVWLLPIMRANLRRCRAPLGCFSGRILQSARLCERAAKAAEAPGGEGGAALAKLHRTRGAQLWGLFPAFCTAPTDLAEAFTPQFAETLCRALGDRRYPELQAVVCRGLEVLVRRTQRAAGLLPAAADATDNPAAAAHPAGGARGGAGRRGSAADSDSDEAGAAWSDSDSDSDGARDAAAALQRVLSGTVARPLMEREEATEALQLLSKSTNKLVPVLFNCFEQSAGGAAGADAAAGRGSAVLGAVAALAAVAPPPLVNRVFARLLSLLGKSLLEATETAGAMEAAWQAAREVTRGDAERAAAAAEEAGEDDERTAAAVRAAKLAPSDDGRARSEHAAAKKEHTRASAHATALLGLALALAPALQRDNVQQLYAVVKPAVLDDSAGTAMAALQKRAYGVLERICACHAAFLLEDERRDELLGLLVESLMACSASAKRSRLRCLRHLVRALDLARPDHVAIVPLLIGEVMLCTKETNGRARAAAFDLLVAIAGCMAAAGDASGADDAPRAAPDADADGDGEDLPPASLTQFFHVLLAALAAGTPHMRSAGVISLARMLYEFGAREDVLELLPSLLDTVLLLLRERAREVVKSALGFVKVVIVVAPDALLEERLPALCEALMQWSGDTKNHFRAKIRDVLERLAARVGLDAVAAHVPASDSKLVTHMRKQLARRRRKRAGRSDAHFDELVASGDEAEGADADADGPDAADGATKRNARRKAAQKPSAWIVGEGGAGGAGGAGMGDDDGDDVADPIDFLDASAATRAVVTRDPAAAARARARREAERDELQTDEHGRLIVPDDDAAGDAGMDSDDDAPAAARAGRRRRGQGDLDNDERPVGKQQGWGLGKAARLRQRALERGGGGGHDGSAYGSKRAAGDARKKGQKLEPFAYVPLDARAISGSGGDKSVARFANIVGTGGKKGTKAERKAKGGRGKRRRVG